MSNLLRTYAFIVTNAPAAYDHGNAVDHVQANDSSRYSARILDMLTNENDLYIASKVAERGDKLRLVLVPSDSVEYQRDRYLSGMYVAIILTD